MTGRRSHRATQALFLLWGLAICSAAHADPCEAIPEKGPIPTYLHPGGTFRGPVVYVGDGDSLCVAVGRYVRSPDNWVEVRLADFYAPELNAPGGREAKKALERIAMGQRARCWARRRSHDRVVAHCSIDNREIGDLMRAAGVAEGGRGR
jgi:micrococcal nuclease